MRNPVAAKQALVEAGAIAAAAIEVISSAVALDASQFEEVTDD